MIEFFAHLEPFEYRGSREFWNDPRYREFTCLPVSEGELLREYVRRRRPRRILEIGCHVGLSTAYIAVDAKSCIDVVDNFAKNPNVESAFWENMRNCGLIGKVRLWRLSSPDCLSEIANGRFWSFVFIDGYHHAGQPLRDVRGVLQHLTKSGTIVLHDTYEPDVRTAANHLLSHGFTETIHDTPGNIGFYVRRHAEHGQR